MRDDYESELSASSGSSCESDHFKTHTVKGGGASGGAQDVVKTGAVLYDFHDGDTEMRDGCSTGSAWRKVVRGTSVVVKSTRLWPDSPELDEEEVRRARLEDEAELLEHLNRHVGPEVVPTLMYSGLLPDGSACIATLDAGRSLRHWKPTSKEVALQVAKDAILKLSQVHGAGVLHGDVEMRNTAVDEHNTVRILDFSHSTPVGDEQRGQDREYTAELNDMAMRLEQVLGRSIVDKVRVDLAHLGLRPPRA